MYNSDMFAVSNGMMIFVLLLAHCKVHSNISAHMRSVMSCIPGSSSFGHITVACVQ